MAYRKRRRKKRKTPKVKVTPTRLPPRRKTLPRVQKMLDYTYAIVESRHYYKACVAGKCEGIYVLEIRGEKLSNEGIKELLKNKKKVKEMIKGSDPKKPAIFGFWVDVGRPTLFFGRWPQVHYLEDERMKDALEDMSGSGIYVTVLGTATTRNTRKNALKIKEELSKYMVKHFYQGTIAKDVFTIVKKFTRPAETTVWTNKKK